MSARARRALWATGVGDVAGVGRHILDVVDAGIPGWEVRVLAGAGPLRDALAARGAAIDLPFGVTAGVPASLRSLHRALGSTHAEVLHTHLAWTDLVAAISSARVTRVSTEHGISGHRETYATGRLDGHAMTLAHRGRLRRTRGLICVSRATEGVVRARWRPPLRLDVRVQPNGIDRPATPVARGAGHTVGFLGRFAPEKRVDLLIRAFGVLAAADGAAVLSLAGEGAGEPALRGLVHELGLDDRVRFDGWVDGAAWLPGIDVLALPSVWENCSYALLQALAAGAGVVAAPVGGNPELLPRDALADPTDPAAFAAALARQLREPSQRPALPDRVPTVADMTSAIAGAYAAWVQVDR